MHGAPAVRRRPARGSADRGPCGAEFTLDDLDPALLRRLARAARRRRRRPAVACAPGCRRCCSTSASASCIGEAGLGIAVRRRTELTQVLGYARPGPHPRRGRPHDRVGGHPARRSRRRPCCRPSASLVSVARRRRRRALPAARRLDDRPARRRGAVLDRRRGGVLGAAPGAAAPADHRDARGRVGLQRRPRRHPGRRPRRAGGARRRGRTRGGCCCSMAVARAGRRRRGRAGRRLAAAAGCCGGSRSASSGLFSIGVVALTVLAYAAARRRCTAQRLHRHATWPALVLGNMRLPHRPAVPRLRRGPGLAGPDRAVRAARACSPHPASCSTSSLPALVVGLVLLLLARPLSVLVVDAAVPGAAGASRRSCPGPGCAAPCRSCSRPCPLTVGTPGVELDLRPRLRARRRSSPSCRGRPCPGWPGGSGSPRPAHTVDVDGRVHAAGGAGRRLLQVQRRARVPAARRRGVRAAAARAAPTSPSWCATARGSCPTPQHGAAARRPAAHRHHRGGAPRAPSSGCARSANAAGWPAGP